MVGLASDTLGRDSIGAETSATELLSVPSDDFASSNEIARIDAPAQQDTSSGDSFDIDVELARSNILDAHDSNRTADEPLATDHGSTVAGTHNINVVPVDSCSDASVVSTRNRLADEHVPAVDDSTVEGTHDKITVPLATSSDALKTLTQDSISPRRAWPDGLHVHSDPKVTLARLLVRKVKDGKVLDKRLIERVFQLDLPVPA